MNRGKVTCETLKAIRQKVADANGIAYTPVKCDYEGECRGTCPNCERERKYIEDQLSLKRKAGKIIKIAGLVTGLTGIVSNAVATEQQSQTNDIKPLTCDWFYFDTGVSYPDYYIEGIDKQASIIMSMPDEVYIITGHTDSRGALAYNMKISLRRAEYIKNVYLKSISSNNTCKKNIPIIIPVSLGPIAPFIPNAKTEEEHEPNRRTTLMLYKEHTYTGEAEKLINEAVKKYMMKLKKEGDLEAYEKVRKVWWEKTGGK